MFLFHRCCCLALVSGLVATTTFGQGPGKFPALTVIPPSPEAANLGRYAASPIGLYTGTPQISVPLVDIVDGPLKLPLSLSYNASGNRVEDMASWVGLGWALNAGGVITRAARGAADDQQPSSLNTGLVNFFDVSRAFTYDQLANASSNALDGSAETQLLVRAAKGCADVQPDVFYFNFNGYTGQFSFDWNRQLIISSTKDVQVEPTYAQGVITSWRATTEDGTVYVFASPEYTTTRPQTFNVANCTPALGHRFISSWYLTSMTDVNQEHQLTFEYDAYRVSYGLRFTDAIENGVLNCASLTDIGVNRSSQSYTDILGLRLARIFSSNRATTVELVAVASARTDTVGLVGGRNANLRALDHVTVRNGTGTEVKTVFLSYYAGNPTGRLTLWQVQQGRLGGEKLPGHVFNYNTWIPLPADIRSRAQDHWGFYNGGTQNDALGSLVPGCKLPALEGRVIIQAGAYREVSPDSAQAGILTAIRYPTGGYSTYAYEPNEYGYVNRRTLASLKHYTTTRVYYNISALKGPIPPNQSGGCADETVSFRIPQPKARAQLSTGNTFTFPPNDSVFVHVTGTASSSGRGNNAGGNRPFAEILNSTGRRVKWTGYASATNTLRTVDFIFGTLPGLYSLHARACNFNDDGLNGYDSSDIAVDFDADSDILLKGKAGGLRVRMIRDYSSASDSSYTEKTFNYSEKTNPNGSSGCIYAEPHYEYLTEYVWMQNSPTPLGQPVPTVCDYWLRIARNRTSLGSMQGGLVGYREVTATNRVNHQPHSQSTYRFTSPVEYPDSIVDVVPFPPALAFGHRTGLLLEQTDYRSDPTGVVAVKKTENSYRFYETQAPGLAVANPNVLGPGSVVTGNMSFFNRPYTTQLGHAQSASTRETLYDASGAIGHTREQLFTYDALGTRVITENQRLGVGVERATRYWYPPDYRQAPGGLYARMAADLHVIAPIESVTSYIKASDTTVVAGSFQGFALQGTKLRVVKDLALRTAAPIAARAYHYSASTSAATPDARLEERAVVDAYDVAGNVTQLHQTQGLPVARLWGYGRAYLLAEVQNATYADLVRVLGQAVVDQLAGLAPGTDAAVRAALQPLRTQLKEARVATFTYQPQVGVTSQTDPAGRTTTYEYDQFNRLLRARDEQNRILTQQQYHYGRP